MRTRSPAITDKTITIKHYYVPVLVINNFRTKPNTVLEKKVQSTTKSISYIPLEGLDGSFSILIPFPFNKLHILIVLSLLPLTTKPSNLQDKKLVAGTKKLPRFADLGIFEAGRSESEAGRSTS